MPPTSDQHADPKLQRPPGKTVAEIGEFPLISLMFPESANSQNDLMFEVPPGDDAAVTHKPSSSLRSVMTADMLVEGTHFLANAQTDWHALGCKAAAVNLSDLAAMGARPRYALLSLGTPGTARVQDLVQFASGLSQTLGQFGAVVAGGDTVRAESFLFNVALIGDLPDTAIALRRNTVQPGDEIFVSGSLGGSRAGLEQLLANRNQFAARATALPLAVQRHLWPEPRLALGQWLAANLPRCACIDVSDSLVSECRHLARASGVKLCLKLDEIPVWPELPNHPPPSVGWHAYAACSGEEYELLFAAPPGSIDVERVQSETNTVVTRIGFATSGPDEAEFCDANGNPRDLMSHIFSHFV